MTDTTAVTEAFSAIAYGESVVFESLTDMPLDSLERSGLDERTYLMARIAGLIAMDATPAAYFTNAAAASEILDIDDARGLLIALAPVVGSARIASASAALLDLFFVEAEAAESEEDLDETDPYLGVLVQDQAPEHVAFEAEDTQVTVDDRDLETV